MSGTVDVEIFAALGDATRWRILQKVGREPSSASALAEQLPITRQAIMRHLDVLERAGLVESRRHGRERRYVALGARLNAAARLLDDLGAGWDTRLASIKSAAENEA
ncbi:ArsR/SmtB family transcription factor [Paramicrobacterium agarici]|uniref:ArsR/SmtB family transcription factor n=1 Tax=Paramicrobacterium agarici TaxID=630514 RepID=UPI00114E8954|nr:metalloregulator ArsR/SmtB family transcription factor [Microbacterium agarici]TQO23165.1 helix-turn-helix protein [Microbacterium agarici]